MSASGELVAGGLGGFVGKLIQMQRIVLLDGIVCSGCRDESRVMAFELV